MLPDGWKSGKLADQLDHIIDYRGTSVPKAKSGIPLITARNVRKGFLDLSTTEYIDPNAEKEWMSRGYPHAGDILFTTEAPLGNIAKFPEHGKFCIGQRVVALRTKKHVLTSDFLLYQLLSDKGQDLIDERSSGSTAKGIKTKELKKISILIPPLPEQKKIAAILSTWDRAIEGTEKLLANSQQQKKALMQQLLTGKKRLPGFTGEWEKVSLEKTGKIVSGGTPDTTVPAYWDGDVLWLTPTDVTSLRGKYVDDTKRKITQTGIKDSSTILLPVGSLLVCTRATIGYMAIAKKPITTNQGFKNIVFNKLFLPEFVYYFLCTQKHEIQRLASGSTFAEISKKDFGKIHISAPLLPEQKAIATVLTTADEEITALESDLARLRQEKKALMQQLLTGKRRVTVD